MKRSGTSIIEFNLGNMVEYRAQCSGGRPVCRVVARRENKTRNIYLGANKTYMVSEAMEMKEGLKNDMGCSSLQVPAFEMQSPESDVTCVNYGPRCATLTWCHNGLQQKARYASSAVKDAMPQWCHN